MEKTNFIYIYIYIYTKKKKTNGGNREEEPLQDDQVKITFQNTIYIIKCLFIIIIIFSL